MLELALARLRRTRAFNFVEFAIDHDIEDIDVEFDLNGGFYRLAK